MLNKTETKYYGMDIEREMFTPKLGGGRGQLWKSLFPGPEVMDKTWSSQSGGKGT